MNFAAFERAQVAAFAYREARFTGSLDAMRAVCFVLRNRVKSAWGDGTFLSVMEGAHLTAASNDLGGPQLSVGSGLNGAALASDRLLQLIVRDVDDIYMGSESFEDSVAQITAAHKQGSEVWKPVLYYSFLNRPARPWFVENIVRRADEHPQIGQIGAMMLYR